MGDIAYEIVYDLICKKNIDNLIFDREYPKIIKILGEIKKEYTQKEFQTIKKFVRDRSMSIAKYSSTEYNQLKNNMKKL